MKKRLFLLIICVFGGMILTARAQNDSNASTLKAEEISNRMIDLLKSVKTKVDVTPENIERLMKIKVVFNKENRQNYGFGGTIEGAPKWAYNLSIYSNPDDEKMNTNLNFSFNYLNDDEKSGRDEYTPVCKVDFDAYSKALKDAGFSSAPYYGEHGRLLWWNFSRGAVHVQIIAYGENGQQPNRQCVSMLTVSVSDPTATAVGENENCRRRR